MLHIIEYFAKSLKVIENGIIRKLEYCFLFAFYSNYGPFLYRFRDKQNNSFFHTIPPFDGPVTGPRRNRPIVIKFGTEKN